MKGKFRPLPVLLSGLILTAVACSTGDPARPVPDRIAVSILPQRFLVERIAGKRFPVDVLIPPGYSPATYAPTPGQIRDLSYTRVWFRIGRIPFETVWEPRIRATHPRLMVVDTSRGVEWIQPAGSTGTARGRDPHIWLSPRAVRIQAGHILAALKRLDPDHADQYRAGYDRTMAEISAVDAKIREILANVPSRSFLVFHPSWSYFARDYRLEQVAIEVEGKSPAPADLARTIARAREKGLKTVFVQRQFDTDAAEVVARELGGRVVPLDPLAADWGANLLSVARALRASLETQP